MEAIADGVGDGVFPGEVQRRLRHVHRDDGQVVDEDAPFPHGYGKRDGDSAAARPDIGHAERSGADRHLDVSRAITSPMAVSTSSSVSGRGISARASTVRTIPWNSFRPRRYATGSPPRGGDQCLVGRLRIDPHRGIAMGDDRGPVDADRMGEQQLSVESGRPRSRLPGDVRCRPRPGYGSRSSGPRQSRMVTATSPTLRRTSALVVPRQRWKSRSTEASPTRRSVRVTLPSHSGRCGCRSSSSWRSACARKPSMVSRKRNDEPAAHACGEHATG